MKSRITAAMFSILLFIFLSYPVLAQTGKPFIHDPSTIQECDGKYGSGMAELSVQVAE